MAVFRFRLQILLEQKLQAKKEAEEELAKRQAELAAEQNTLADLQRRAGSLTQELHNARREGVHMSSVSGQEPSQLLDIP